MEHLGRNRGFQMCISRVRGLEDGPERVGNLEGKLKVVVMTDLLSD